MALGLKGGFALAQSGLTGKVLISLGDALGMAVLVPVLRYLVLRRFLNRFNAAAIAATYLVCQRCHVYHPDAVSRYPCHPLRRS